MAGIISGFVAGLSKGVADVGELTLKDQLAKEREEANYLRDKALAKTKQEFLGSENQKDRESRQKVAKTKSVTGKDTRTSQQKNVQFLMSKEGGNKPMSEAVTLAFPSSKIKHTDKEGNQIVVVPDGKGGFTEVGKIVLDEKGDQQWLNKGEVLKNAEITTAHRKKAKSVASEKAGTFRTDKTDFPSTGGDRKAFTKQEAQRIANKERATKKGSGIVGGAIKSSDMMIPGDTAGSKEADTKMVGKRKISKKEYIDKMVTKYGKENLLMIEKQWQSY